jgi:hypothetical protein
VKFVNLNQFSRKSFEKNIFAQQTFPSLEYEQYLKYNEMSFLYFEKKIQINHACIFVGRVAFIEITIQKWFLLFLIMVQGGVVIDWNLRDYFSGRDYYYYLLLFYQIL